MDMGRMMQASANPAEVVETVRMTFSALAGMIGSNPLENIKQAVEKVRTTLLLGTGGHHSGGFDMVQVGVA